LNWDQTDFDKVVENCQLTSGLVFAGGLVYGLWMDGWKELKVNLRDCLSQSKKRKKLPERISLQRVI
jgi:hypothetical protein